MTLMKKMQKDINEVKSVISTLHSQGVQPFVYNMFGFPTETKEEMEESFEFLMYLNKKFNCNVRFANQFNLVEDSPAFLDPKSFGITEIKKDKSWDASQGYGYDFVVESGMNQKQVSHLCSKAQFFLRHPWTHSLYKSVSGRVL